jgi:hypothetical protein
MQTNKPAFDAEIAEVIVCIPHLARAELTKRWRKRFGVDPPKGCGRRLLELAAAYDLQERAFGGLKPDIRKVLAAGRTGPIGCASSLRTKNKIIKPGTRFIREWKGRTHYVEVVEGGFFWNGQLYRSLSTIAKSITGAHWSGPRFFGI